MDVSHVPPIHEGFVEEPMRNFPANKIYQIKRYDSQLNMSQRFHGVYSSKYLGVIYTKKDYMLFN